MKKPPINRLEALPLHLGLAGLLWLSSNNASQLLKSALPPSKASNLNPNVLAALQRAVQDEARQRVVKLLEGISKYQRLENPPTPRPLPSKIIWKQGSARLLDYGGDGLPVMLIPSLINRYYVLDLAPGQSLTAYLKKAGFRPLIVDWGTPGQAEAHFTCSHYIEHYLASMLDKVIHTTGMRPVLAGYCMGGLLALAQAQLTPAKVAGLALLATPWDFHSKDFRRVELNPTTLAQAEQLILSQDMLPAEVVQTIIYTVNPWIFHYKFRLFADIDTDTKHAEEFLTLEHWVNDGVPLVKMVAKECLIDWTQRNIIANYQWRVGNELIDPRNLYLPTFIATPTDDRIVPQGCALPLADLMPHATLIEPDSGHVGMVVGKKAEKELWKPLVKWLNKL